MNFKFLIYFTLFLGFISCNKSNNIDKPNVILIMSDDLGYEAMVLMELMNIKLLF